VAIISEFALRKLLAWFIANRIQYLAQVKRTPRPAKGQGRQKLPLCFILRQPNATHAMKTKLTLEQSDIKATATAEAVKNNWAVTIAGIAAMGR
jgi:hypothetical protein